VEELATADSLRSQPVYRERRGISTAWRGKIPHGPGDPPRLPLIESPEDPGGRPPGLPAIETAPVS